MLRRQQDEHETTRQGEAPKHQLVANLQNLCTNVGATEHPTTNHQATNLLAAIGRLAGRHPIPTICMHLREHTALRLLNRILTAPDTRSTDTDKNKARLTQYQGVRVAPDSQTTNMCKLQRARLDQTEEAANVMANTRTG